MYNIEDYRREDDTFDLETAFDEYINQVVHPEQMDLLIDRKYTRAVLYLNDVECIQPIVSAQSAAIAIATAINIWRG